MADHVFRNPPQQALQGPAGVGPLANHAPRNDGTHPPVAPTPKSRGATSAVEIKDSLREVVETVVFVVVLVLLLKAFVAEAFVIPTGSMAETLYGYQKTVKCPKCDEEFPVNCSNEVNPQDGPPIPVLGCTCPVCRYQIDFRKERIDPSCSTGDRVLVAKFVYDFPKFNQDRPKRGQVVVFKYPERPQRNYEAMNYIKRLIGQPGETIAIREGKLYVSNSLSYDDSGVPEKDLWRREYMHQDDPQAHELFDKGQFRIVRKPPEEILAMRRIVFDNAHQARDLIGKVPPRWAAEGSKDSWIPDKADEPRSFQHRARSDDEIAWLRYRHLIPSPDRLSARPELITDFMGYNTGTDHPFTDRSIPPPQNWVGDLMLECEVQADQSQGELVLELSKGVDRFRAHFDVGSGTCTLARVAGGREEKLETKDTPFRKPGKYRLRFANVDERLLVWVNSDLPFGDGVVYEPPHSRGPTEANDLQPASIGARGSAFTVSQVKLWRDTYYTVHVDRAADREIDFSRPADWQVLADLPVKTMYVQPHHFLCLGDNSPASSDSRSWGVVPERLLLGRALAIYYPIWRAGRIE
jgi:signal peptidase I